MPEEKNTLEQKTNNIDEEAASSRNENQAEESAASVPDEKQEISSSASSLNAAGETAPGQNGEKKDREEREKEGKEDAENPLELELKKYQEKLKEAEEKLEELENRYLRLYADFENYRRRVKKDFDDAQKYRAQELIADLLPVLDNFERALNFEAQHEETKSHIQGMKMIYNSLLDALKKEGVKEIEAVGKEFDPRVHQAVMQVNEEGYESNIVVEELQKGYMLKDRIIRPSMVKVNQ